MAWIGVAFDPFFAATYLPRHSRGGFVGIVELMEKIGEDPIEQIGLLDVEGMPGVREKPLSSTSSCPTATTSVLSRSLGRQSGLK